MPAPLDTAQQLADLKALGLQLDRNLTAPELDAVSALARTIVDLRDPDPARPLPADHAIIDRTRADLLSQAEALAQPDAAAILLPFARILAIARTEIAAALPLPPRPRRHRRLTKPAQVQGAIADVYDQLSRGNIEPADANARLYALQALLHAMYAHARLLAEDTAPKRLKT